MILAGNGPFIGYQPSAGADRAFAKRVSHLLVGADHVVRVNVGTFNMRVQQARLTGRNWSGSILRNMQRVVANGSEGDGLHLLSGCEVGGQNGLPRDKVPPIHMAHSRMASMAAVPVRTACRFDTGIVFLHVVECFWGLCGRLRSTHVLAQKRWDRIWW